MGTPSTTNNGRVLEDDSRLAAPRILMFTPPVGPAALDWIPTPAALPYRDVKGFAALPASVNSSPLMVVHA